MNPKQIGGRDDQRVNVKVVLSGLWVSMLFVFAYVDIFGFWRADVINGALDGRVPGAGFDVDQTFLALTTVYILVPSLMVAFSLIAPARATGRSTSSSASCTPCPWLLLRSATLGPTTSSAASSRSCCF
jgi:hypothetical protein